MYPIATFSLLLSCLLLGFTAGRLWGEVREARAENKALKRRLSHRGETLDSLIHRLQNASREAKKRRETIVRLATQNLRLAMRNLDQSNAIDDLSNRLRWSQQRMASQTEMARIYEAIKETIRR